MSSIARYATIRPLFEVHVHFFMRNEILSEDIRKYQNVLLFAFLILHSYNQWRN